MGKVGRPKKYDTPQEAAEAKKESDKISREKYNTKKNAEIENDPVLRKEAIQKQIIANAKYLAKVPQEKKRKNWARQRRNWKAKRESKPNKIPSQKNWARQRRNWKAKRESKPNKIPSQMTLFSQIKQFQQQVSCEQAEQLEFFIK